MACPPFWNNPHQAEPTEDALRRYQAMLEAVVEGTSDAIFVKDAQGRYLMFNSGASSLSGKPAEEILGKDDTALFAPDEARHVMEGDRHIMASDITQTHEECVTIGGLARTFLSTKGPVRDAQGKCIGLFGIARDITERKKQAEESLKLQSDNYMRMLNAIGEGIYVVSRYYDIEYVNPALASEFGEVAGRKCFAYFHDRREPCPWCKNDEVFKGNMVRWEWHSDKTGKTYDLLDAPLINADGSVSKIEIFHDITERKQAEEKIWQLNQDYDRLTDNADEAIFRVEAAGGHVIYCNPAAERIFGYSLAEWQADPELGFKLIHPDYREKQQQIIERIRRNKHPAKNEELGWIVKGGNTVLMEYTILPICDAEGEVVIFESIGRDITERKQAAEALHASEERWKFALEGAGDGIWDWDISSGTTLFSKRYKQMLGYAEHELRDHYEEWASHVHPDDFLRVQDALLAHFADRNTPYSVELRMRCKDGSWKWILARGKVMQWDDRGQPLRMIGTHTDISCIRHAEDRLRTLSTVVEQSPLSIVIAGLDARLQYVNPNFERVTGYSFAEAIGNNPRILQSGLTSPETYQEMWQTLTQGGIWHGEFCNKKKNGELYWEDVHIVPIRNNKHEITHYAGIKLDITESKHVKEALRKTNEELEARVLTRTAELDIARQQAEAANQAKSDFLANMSHEIRTPMNSVIGMAHLALKTDLDPRQRDYVSKILVSSENLLGIINDILDFSKIEAGRLELEELDFELTSLLDALASQLTESAERKGLKLSVESDPALPPILRGDPLRLRQILTNLIGNAIKFSERGSISVRARLAESGADDTLVRFEVQDSGIGISREMAVRLFESFRQGDPSTTRKYGGTGLGLAISKQLAEKMGGQIGVESQPGNGSTFWFTARFRQGAMPHVIHRVTPAIHDEALDGARILLAEDNLFNQQVAQELLEQAGIQVSVVGNGREAIEQLQQQKFDLVLMDVQMPEMDGYEATRLIRANPALAAMPVIAITANARNEDQLRCREAGMDDFISKPVEPARMFATLRQWLKPHAAAEPAASIAQGTQADAGKDLLPIDLSVLEKTLGNRPEKIRKYALMFVQTLHDDMVEIDAALAHGDLVQLGNLGHRIKSSARTVGATAFAELCLALEQFKSGAGRLEQAQAIVAQMRAMQARIEELIHRRPA